MATTNFIDEETVIEADWANDIDNFFYTIFGGTTYASQAFNIDNTTGDVSVLNSSGTALLTVYESSGDISIGPAASPVLFLDVSANQLQIGKGLSTEAAFLEIGTGRTGDGNCFIDLITDATYTDYGLRINRTSGANGNSFIDNRGTGSLILNARDAGSVAIRTNNTVALTVDSSQNVGIGASSPLGKLQISQTNASGAIPVLYLDQDDVSEEILQISSTAGTGNAIEAVGAKTLTTTHFIKITLNGLTRYIPCGTIA